MPSYMAALFRSELGTRCRLWHRGRPIQPMRPYSWAWNLPLPFSVAGSFCKKQCRCGPWADAHLCLWQFLYLSCGPAAASTWQISGHHLSVDRTDPELYLKASREHYDLPKKSWGMQSIMPAAQATFFSEMIFIKNTYGCEQVNITLHLLSMKAIFV